MTMNVDELSKIRQELANADEQMIREIVRQAESFLSAQLQSGLAADLRSMTMAAILAAVLSFLVGGTASLIAAEIDLGLHLITISELVLVFGVALIFAILAASPTKFDYAGSNPKHWVSDIENRHSFVRAMAGQAAQYADGISDNSRILRNGQSWLKRSLSCIFWGIFLGLAIEVIIALDRLARTGSIYAT